MEEIYDRGGKIPSFDGNAKYFANWWKKFLANATMNKYKDTLKETQDPYLPRKEVSNKDYNLLTKEQRQAIKKNEIAMAGFSMAFITDKAMNMVFLALMEGWEEGEAHLVVKELMKQY
jgi:hypothetical protein